jgi:glyoxylase-like metal-dependent hydrolase (beta-lactamase superfamily II)
MCPVGGRYLDGCSRGLTGRLACHCLLLETDRGLVLVDTGLGLRDVLRPYPRLSPLYVNLLNVQFDPERTALWQVRRLGFDPRDVRDVVLTHLDFDHAGGLEDFPWARVHVTSRELRAAHARHGFVARRRYRPRQWDGIRRWRHYEASGGERWHGFRCVRDLDGLPPEILLVPLAGHTWGHAGVAVDTGDGWLLHAGDAYFYRGEMRNPERRCTPGLALYQTLMEVDRAQRLHNQQRLRALSLDPRARDVTIFCGHDRREFEALRDGRPLRAPSPPRYPSDAMPGRAASPPHRRPDPRPQPGYARPA